MSADENPPIRPSTETNVLLGRLEAKVDNLTAEQASGRTEFAGLRAELAILSTKVAVIEAKQAPKTPWYSLVGGITSGVVGLSSIIALITVFARVGVIN